MCHGFGWRGARSMERVSQVTLHSSSSSHRDTTDDTHTQRITGLIGGGHSTVSVPLSVGWCEEWQRRVAYHGARNTRGLRFVVNRNSPGRSFWSVGRSRWLLCVQSLFQPHTTTPRAHRVGVESSQQYIFQHTIEQYYTQTRQAAQQQQQQQSVVVRRTTGRALFSLLFSFVPCAQLVFRCAWRTVNIHSVRVHVSPPERQRDR